MRFLVDANVPRSALGAFARSGHQADHVNDVGLMDAPDEQIARRAQETLAVIVTRDLDFADIRRYPSKLYAINIGGFSSDDAASFEDYSQRRAAPRRMGLGHAGMTELRLDDPDGNHLWIGQSKPEA